MPDIENSAAFILTHGRPDRVITLDLLKRAGWTRPVYLIIDDEDSTANEYFRRYGRQQVIMFSKEEIERTFDVADTQRDRRTITYARNASFAIARELGIDYHIQLDDDYVQFEYRYANGDKLACRPIKSFTDVFDALARFLDVSGAKSVAMAQGGDFLGGVTGGVFQEGYKRKAMNSFICRTDRPFTFVGRMNEDVNTYVTLGTRGELFFTIPDCSLIQTATQSQSGGITDLYLKFGTYTKSFFTVMMAPSCVKVGMMYSSNQRIHHQISWDNVTPKIISKQYRKPRPNPAMPSELG